MSSRLLLVAMLCIVYIAVAVESFGYGNYGYQSYGPKITLYEYPNKGGQSYFVSIKECVNLNSLAGAASSVAVHGTCVKLYNQKYCAGNSVYLKPGRDYYNLYDFGFDKQAYSAGAC